jgi:hypothetical protein
MLIESPIGRGRAKKIMVCGMKELRVTAAKQSIVDRMKLR